MRRGFKAESERMAERHRRSIGATVHDRLDPWRLAERLGVTVVRPEEVPGLSPDSLAQLVVHDKDSWSAVTLQFGKERMTIVNSAHAETRQRNSLCHELAHILLAHEPSRIDVSAKGYLILGSCEGDEEREANWLSGALLVPRAGVMRKLRESGNKDLLAAHFGVSLDLLRWRLNTTGVLRQLARAERYRRGPAGTP